MSRTVLAAVLLAALAAPASAALYKWTDANGRVVYSDIPPTGNVKVETVGAPPPPSNPKAVQEMAAKEVEIKKRATDAADQEKKAETQRAEAAKRLDMCQRAEQNIRQLAATQVSLIRYNEKGEAFYLDEATRRKERADIEQWMTQNCSSIAKN